MTSGRPPRERRDHSLPAAVHGSRFAARSAGLALILALALPAPAWAQADYAREQRWADEITPAILVGDPVYLEAAGRRFLAIHAPAPKPHAAVILVHGIGVHPDWGLVNTLRSELPDRGYSTLSIQMPVLAADAKPEAYSPLFPEAAARLAASVRYLRQKGSAKVAIISHSLGSRMTDAFLAAQETGAVDAWVSIGLTGGYSNAAALRLPVLDLYGENDLPGVLKAAPARASALENHARSRQVRVPGADHFFDRRGAELVAAVQSFLDGEFKR